MAETPVYKLELPSDSTLVSQTPAIMRSSAGKIENALVVSDSKVTTAMNAAEASALSAQQAATLVNAPAGAAVDAAIQRGGAAYGSLEKAISEQDEAQVQESAKAFGVLMFKAHSRFDRPAPLVFVGSSSVAGFNTDPENRWVNLLGKTLGQPTTMTRTEAVDALPLEPGYHLVNCGFGGTTAADYVWQAMADNIGQFEPAAVIHMVGSNDFRNDIDPSVYEANVRSKLNMIDSASAVPTVHIMIHTYRRPDHTTPAYEWEEYRSALHRIAGSRKNVSVLDISGQWETLDIAQGDPFGLIQSDDTHMSNAGHQVMAAMVERALGLPQPAAPTETVLFSDTFTGGVSGQSIDTRTVDNGLGGARTIQWEAQNALQIVDGNLTRLNTYNYTWFGGFNSGQSNGEFSVQFAETPSHSDGIYIVGRRPKGKDYPGTAPDHYGILITPESSALLRRVGTAGAGGTNEWLTVGPKINPNDWVSLRIVDDVIEALINGIPVMQVRDKRIIGNTYWGISGTVNSQVKIRNAKFSAIS